MRLATDNLPHVKKFLFLPVLALLLVPMSALASTQEFLAIVDSGAGATAKVKTVTVFYVSHDVSPGTHEMFDPNPNCVFMINDVFVTRRAFLRAVTPGKRLYCRGNRSKGQFYGVYTTPFYAADGIIDSADGATAKITHTQGYIMCTPPTIQQTVSAAPGVPVKLEGKVSTAAEALKPGRHVRVIKPRKQIVQIITADAWVSSLDEVKATYPFPKKGSFIHAVDGFLRERSGNGFKVTMGGKSFTDINLETKKKVDRGSFLVDGQYVPDGAALRPGVRTLFCPDQIIGHANPYRLFQVTTADGTIEGVVKSIANGKLIIETQTCPPEATAACKKSERAVTLDPGAEYHINGVVGFAAEKKPDAAVNFTHLRFTVLEGERGLGRGISELRFVVGDKELGPGAKASGDNGFETMFDGNNRTLVKWKSGRNAAITCDDPVAPTAVKLWTSEGGRGVRSFRVEGAKADSTDGLNWVELLHYDAGDGKIIPKDKWVTIPIYLNDVDPVPVSIAKALVPGSFVRILPALPKGAILVRDVKRN
jgi:hypothetical protein|tara:strand:- start:151 stop:1758 length:1608 start_codon:yes stop_codon:yes gene_type:complete